MFPPNQTRVTATVTQCGAPWDPESILYFGVQQDKCIPSLAFKPGFSVTDVDNAQFGSDRCVAVHNIDGSVSGVTGKPGHIAVYKRRRKFHTQTFPQA